MTSQDIKKQLKEPHFWNIVLTGQHAEPRTKAMLEAKGIITCLLYTSPSPRDYAASRMPSSA